MNKEEIIKRIENTKECLKEVSFATWTKAEETKTYE